MGAIRKNGDEFLNYLLNEGRSGRISNSQSLIRQATVPLDFQVYIFGSYLRREIYKDIDFILVYPTGTESDLISSTVENIRQVFKDRLLLLDITICSEIEYKAMSFENDNRVRIQ